VKFGLEKLETSFCGVVQQLFRWEALLGYRQRPNIVLVAQLLLLLLLLVVDAC